MEIFEVGRQYSFISLFDFGFNLPFGFALELLSKVIIRWTATSSSFARGAICYTLEMCAVNHLGNCKQTLTYDRHF